MKSDTNRTKARKVGPTVSLDTCADSVETVIKAAGIPLTMGGEPTFIPLFPDGTEWSVDALGPTKLDYARRFSARLTRDLEPGAVLLETSGKHYPGEPVPRWCLQLQWRADGEPLWKNPDLLRSDDSTENPCSHDEAEGFARAVARRLGLAKFVMEATAPRYASDTAPNGAFILPLDHVDGKWISDRWPLRGGKRALLPGDSWAGLRLPIAHLGEKHLKRALSVEARPGGLAVFVPHLQFDAYADLLEMIEAVALAEKTSQLVLAGYAPPADARFTSLGIAADPGVLEINLPPCKTWTEYRRWVDLTYRVAEDTGLCARKLHFNGRRSGTGGGSHLCFGGPVAAESPFFTHPDLLPSILRYWQRHPSLSYAFSGLYIGPSSQAPRPDESLPDALDQLELACKGARALGTPCDPFMYHLLFRDLLTDRGGNTHRAEISVDKLWNASSPNGRMGIIEFRAFETQPDATTTNAVALLVRAIIARLARKPLRAPFRHWGRTLHDQYFLPTALREDVRDIVTDLGEAGIAFDETWLRPAWEFRFPVVGRLVTDDGELVVRPALESWPMLSEQPLGSTTSRAVDSSLERIEVSLPDRGEGPTGHLLVNGCRVPLSRVGGRLLAGIRFRAFYLVPALHPHIEAHAPLTLEWVNDATGRVQAAARWHVWHPKGRRYQGMPRKESAAARRLAQRWQALPELVGEFRQSASEAKLGRAVRGCTLDLRHCRTV